MGSEGKGNQILGLDAVQSCNVLALPLVVLDTMPVGRLRKGEKVVLCRACECASKSTPGLQDWVALTHSQEKRQE